MIRFLLCFLGIFLIGLNVCADDRYNISVSPSDTLSADVINDILLSPFLPRSGENDEPNPHCNQCGARCNKYPGPP